MKNPEAEEVPRLERTSTPVREDRNDLAWWFPRLQAAGVRTPRTEIVTTEADLSGVLECWKPEGFNALCHALEEAADRLGTGYPVFLRTGHGSAKHSWRDTCYLQRASDIPAHVARLIEWSELAGIPGLPTRTWAVREFLPLVHCFRAFGGGLPIAAEVRAFVGDGAVESLHTYWPEDPIRAPSRPDWRELLKDMEARTLRPELPRLHELAGQVAAAFAPGHWSVDFALTWTGEWYALDMAEGERSHRNPQALWTRAGGDRG